MITGIVLILFGGLLLESLCRIERKDKTYFIYVIYRVGEGCVGAERIRLCGDYEYVLSCQKRLLFEYVEKITKRYPKSGILYSEVGTKKIICLESDPEIVFVISKIEKGS